MDERWISGWEGCVCVCVCKEKVDEEKEWEILMGFFMLFLQCILLLLLK